MIGPEIFLEGAFVEIEPPRRLVMLTEANDSVCSMRSEARQTITLEALGERSTRLTPKPRFWQRWQRCRQPSWQTWIRIGSNRDENRLIYIRQVGQGAQTDNAIFSVPEIVDFSSIGFTMNGLGEPREIRAGLVNGSYFEVMGLRPMLGRLLDMHDDGPTAAGACLLTYRSGGESGALRDRCRARSAERSSDGGRAGAVRVALLRSRVGLDRGWEHALDRRGAGLHRGGATCVRASSAVVRRLARFNLAASRMRIAGSTTRRLRAFAVTQIAASFVLLAGASMLLKTLLTLQLAQTGLDTRRVLAINVPVVSYGRAPEQIVNFYNETLRKVRELPGVDGVAAGTVVPWRDANSFGSGFEFSADGHVNAPGATDPRAQMRAISPRFFAALGSPLLAGRDFNDNDRRDTEMVVIISQSLAQRMFPNQAAVNRHIFFTDPVMKFIDVSEKPRRIVGVAADIDDEHVVPGQAMNIYLPFGQSLWVGRMFVHTRAADPYALVNPHHAVDPRHVIGATGGTRGNPRGYTSRSANSRSAEHGGVRRLCGGCVGHRGGRRGWRIGVLGVGPDAGVRSPLGDGIGTAASGDRPRPRGPCHGGDWRGGRRYRRLRLSALGRGVLRGNTSARRDPSGWCRVGVTACRCGRLGDASDSGGSPRCHASAAIGVMNFAGDSCSWRIRCSFGEACINSRSRIRAVETA